MKRRIFLVCLFYCFFKLPIYESIAAIFWQSASYVLFLFQSRCASIASTAAIFGQSARYIHVFSSQIGVVILVTPKQEVDKKIEWFCGEIFFFLIINVECENGV